MAVSSAPQDQRRKVSVLRRTRPFFFSPPLSLYSLWSEGVSVLPNFLFFRLPTIHPFLLPPAETSLPSSVRHLRLRSFPLHLPLHEAPPLPSPRTLPDLTERMCALFFLPSAKPFFLMLPPSDFQPEAFYFIIDTNPSSRLPSFKHWNSVPFFFLPLSRISLLSPPPKPAPSSLKRLGSESLSWKSGLEFLKPCCGRK